MRTDQRKRTDTDLMLGRKVWNVTRRCANWTARRANSAGKRFARRHPIMAGCLAVGGVLLMGGTPLLLGAGLAYGVSRLIPQHQKAAMKARVRGHFRQMTGRSRVHHGPRSHDSSRGTKRGRESFPPPPNGRTHSSPDRSHTHQARGAGRSEPNPNGTWQARVRTTASKMDRQPDVYSGGRRVESLGPNHRQAGQAATRSAAARSKGTHANKLDKSAHIWLCAASNTVTEPRIREKLNWYSQSGTNLHGQHVAALNELAMEAVDNPELRKNLVEEWSKGFLNDTTGSAEASRRELLANCGDKLNSEVRSLFAEARAHAAAFEKSQGADRSARSASQTQGL